MVQHFCQPGILTLHFFIHALIGLLLLWEGNCLFVLSLHILEEANKLVYATEFVHRHQTSENIFELEKREYVVATKVQKL